MVKLTEDLILMQSSTDSSISVVSASSSICDSSCSVDCDKSDHSTCSTAASSPSITNLKKVNCWGRQIDDISIVSQMPDLEVLVLSSNSVSDLSPLMQCTKLSELYLRRNKVSHLDQLSCLKENQSLKTLWLLDNPLAKEENYRLKVIKLLPQLSKLDSKVINEEERNQAMCVELSSGDKTVVDDEPPNDVIVNFVQTGTTGSDESVKKDNGSGDAALTNQVADEDKDIEEIILESPSEEDKVVLVEAADTLKEKKENEKEVWLGEKETSVLSCRAFHTQTEDNVPSLKLFADHMAKTSITCATQAVRQMGIKLYSAPLDSCMENSLFNMSAMNNGESCNDQFSLTSDAQNNVHHNPAVRMGDEAKFSNTYRAIELLLEDLSKEELNQLYCKISSKLS